MIPSAEKKIYSPVLDRCPLCESGKIRKKFTISSYNDPFSISDCRACGFIFMNPPYTPQYINSLYGRNYYEGESGYVYQDERLHEKYHSFVWDARLRIIRKYISEGALLDIGCSFGGFLKRASRLFDPYGIEISEHSGGEARKIFGDRVHTGTLNDHPFGDMKFAAITMIEVLEHMPDPAAAVRECARLTAPGGVLVIQTANMSGLQAELLGSRYAYFMPGHLSYFNASNLSAAVKKAGFNKIRIFYPVEFGLIPKLKKSRMNFNSAADYLKWIRISLYHAAGKIHFKGKAITSSMVMYAIK